MNSICWNITSKCNKNCKYCFREDAESDLPLEENQRLLGKFAKAGVKQISWSGGEPTLYDGITDMVRLSKEYGIYNKLITNASSFNSKEDYSILKYIDEIVFSVDFVDTVENELHGRGNDYFNHIKECISNIKLFYPNCIISFNTVVMRSNLQSISDVYEEVMKLHVNKWKLIQFCPFRNQALKNKDYFSITNNEYLQIYNEILSKEKSFIFSGHTIADMEKHIIVSPNGTMSKKIF